MPNNILEELKTKFEDFASELENIEPEKVDLTQIDRLIALVEELDNWISWSGSVLLLLSLSLWMRTQWKIKIKKD